MTTNWRGIPLYSDGETMPDWNVSYNAQSNALATALDDADTASQTNASVATVAALPGSGNWPGRIIYVEEDGFARIWTGAGWEVFFAGNVTDSCTYGTGFSAAGGLDQNEARIDRIGNRVFLSGTLATSSGRVFAEVLTVAEEFRPATGGTRSIGGNTTSAGISFSMFITATDGVISLPTGYATDSIPVGQTLPLGGMSWNLD